MHKTIDFYYTPISPWSFMGLDRLLAVARRQGAGVRFKPIELPRIFATTGHPPIAQRPRALLTYRLRELRRWRDYLGLRLNLEPKHFPIPDRLACLTLVAAQAQGYDVTELTRTLMRACWVEDRDIADPATVIAIANESGMDGAALVAEIDTPAVQQRWAANTDEAIALETIGVPTYAVEGDVFFGQDRLEFLERKLAANAASPAYLIGRIKVKSPPQWAEYVAGVARSLAPFGAEVLFRGQCHAVLAGATDHDRAVVIRFPDQPTLQAWFESEPYRRLIPLREAAADVMLVSYDAVE